jgi:hypothetical protein
LLRGAYAARLAFIIRSTVTRHKSPRTTAMSRLALLTRLLLAALCVGVFVAPANAGETKRAKRRVFVLHSGIHTIIANPAVNISAERLNEGLQKRGIDARDIVVLSNPFPKATWSNMFPREAVEMYLESLAPGSKVSQEAYLRMDRALKEKKIGPDDEVIWIGHSAGGQLGMTVAHLATKLDKYPDLAKVAGPYRITMVVTLGTPVGANLLPPEVRLRNYFSSDDSVVRLATHSTWVTATAFGFKGRICSCSDVLCKTWEARVFHDIQHHEWTKEERVIDRIMAELAPDHCPCWHSSLCQRPGLCLAQMLSHALSEECHISLEDPPRAKK